ncbi:hypothetical protein DACRYDRAFT_23174 [Dacryopinax primogenitus]|uniref:Uncharacterized protein n=1 Tax=Dacryopinax primogenitus (strain DJM 731) TaxID=1858805 RepID=M5G2Y6_DACPD|nr:uncharacterized protein DACRYDRAFT_23174 [Dacryopinax primogenitus]EJU00187.1 hypothetical protein DACRYDRAFT_23174 [Dacryopinax primogenitus]
MQRRTTLASGSKPVQVQSWWTSTIPFSALGCVPPPLQARPWPVPAMQRRVTRYSRSISSSSPTNVNVNVRPISAPAIASSTARAMGMTCLNSGRQRSRGSNTNKQGQQPEGGCSLGMSEREDGLVFASTREWLSRCYATGWDEPVAQCDSGPVSAVIHHVYLCPMLLGGHPARVGPAIHPSNHASLPRHPSVSGNTSTAHARNSMQLAPTSPRQRTNLTR